MDVSLNSVTYGELACSSKDNVNTNNDKEITIDDVLDFIRMNGIIYESQIKECLVEAKNSDRSKMNRIVNRRRSMYERLSKL